MSDIIRVLLADDHHVFCKGLRQIIESESDMRVVGECHDGSEVPSACRSKKPDMLLLDIEMPKVNGIKAASTLLNKNPNSRIVFLSMHKDEEFFNDAMATGAMGYVLKDSAHLDVVPAIRCVVDGRRFVSSGLSEFLFARRDRSRELIDFKPEVRSLTVSERRILKLISMDLTTKEIANKLGVSPHTVTNHRANICSKLGINGSHSLLKFAYDHKERFRASD